MGAPADDDLSNLVAAHRRCNCQKSASLAAVAHLAHWRDRLQGGALDRIARRTGWSHDPERALARARAVYRWTPPATPLWRRDAEYEPWREFDVRRALRPSALRAAENPPDSGSWR